MNLLEEFISYLRSQKNQASKATIKNYKADVKKFISWYEAEFSTIFDPKQITPHHIQLYKKIQTSPELSLNLALSLRSLDRHLSSLRKFFHFLKIEGHVAQDPIQELAVSHTKPVHDTWHIKDFKDHLYVYNLSHTTIKNYIIDIKQFFSWAEAVSGVKEAWDIKEKNIFDKINQRLIEEYKQRLVSQVAFSPTSVNRKLSALRKFFTWAAEEGIIKTKPVIESAALLYTQKPIPAEAEHINEVPLSISNSIETSRNITGMHTEEVGPEPLFNTEERFEAREETLQKNKYSRIPQLRLMQKLVGLSSLAFDLVLTIPIAEIGTKFTYLQWLLHGKPIFQAQEIITQGVESVSRMRTNTAANARRKILIIQKQAAAARKRSLFPIRNIKKEFYAPLSISVSNLPWNKKLLHHLRHTRPQWYRKYHSYPVVHYFHFAILVIFMSIIGFLFYQKFFDQPHQQPILAALPASPPRILSFQGRLTNVTDTPITAATTMRFGIYTSETATGSALLWEEVDTVSPDADGVFSVLLGKNTTISQSLFAQNPSLWLGITVKQDSELTPRQQLATVAFASNAETLQGLPPITQNGAGTQNVVLALDSGGNLHIGGSSGTTFDATGGQFRISGQPLLLTTNVGTNGDIQIIPDGFGKLDIQKGIYNSSNNNKLSSAQGSVEIDDTFSILATTSGQSVFTLNQDATGPLISASTSGVPMFTVGNDGSGYFAGNLGIGTQSASQKLEVMGNVYANNGQIRLGNFSSAPVTIGIGSMYYDTSSNQMFLSNGSTWSAVGSGSTNWSLSGGALSPVNTSYDVLFGGSSTMSAKFGVLNMGSGTPIASLSATSNGNGIAISSDATIQSFRNNTLTLGGNTTGNILLLPNNSSGFVGLNTTSPNATLTVNGSASFYNENIINFYTDTGTTKRGFMGAGRNNNLSIVSKQNTYLRIGSVGDVAMWANGNAELDDNPQFILKTSGNVGIGLVNPGLKLDLSDTQTATGVAQFTNASSGTDADGVIVKLGFTGTGTQPTSLNSYVGNRFMVFQNGVGAIQGAIESNGINGVNYKTSGADFAEYFKKASSEQFEAGDLVVLSKNEAKKSSGAYDSRVLGVVSTNPGFTGGQDGPDKVLVGLVGQTPVKVSGENGRIHIGDSLVPSSKPGIAMKATKPSYSIGKALENYESSDTNSVGSIKAYVSASWYDPHVEVSNSGNLNISESQVPNLPTTYSIATDSSTPISRIGAFSQALIAHLKAGAISAKELSVHSLEVSGSNFSIAGQSLHDYIYSIVGSAQATSDIISPILEADRVKTNGIAPLAGDTIKVEGNASVSGTLVAEKVETQQASVAGTISAQTLVADQLKLSEDGLAKLNEQLNASSSSTYITNITNVYQSSISAKPELEQQTSSTESAKDIVAIRQPAEKQSQIQNETASDSARDTRASDTRDTLNLTGYAPLLNTVDTLTINYGKFAHGLIAFGPASFEDASVVNQLSIGGSMILTDTSMNVLGATLELQPLRQGNFSVMGGLLTLDTDGNLKAAGNAQFEKEVTIKGTLMAGIIAPVPNGDVIIRLSGLVPSPLRGKGQGEGENSQRSSAFVIQNSTGSAVLKIDSLGNLIASGSASVSKVIANTLHIVRGAQADTSLTETVATASAGIATIVAGEMQRTIISPYVTDTSLIYITPTTDTQGITPYISRQTPQTKQENGKEIPTGDKGSFTIEIPQRLYKDLTVNWWIVN